MMKSKKRKNEAAQRNVVRATVASPLSPGTTDQVSRVLDTIDAMARRGQIDQRRWEAANRLRTAWDVVRGADGGAGNFESVRGSGFSGAPLPAMLAASDTLTDAKRALYPVDYRLVVLVVCEQKTLAQAAQILGSDMGRTSPRRAGDALWKALGVLADRWQPCSSSARLRGWQHEASRVTEIFEVQRQPTAHADGRRVRHVA